MPYTCNKKNIAYRISYIVILIGTQISQLTSRKHARMVEPIMQTVRTYFN